MVMSNMQKKKCVLITVEGDDGRTITAKICGKDLAIKVVEEE